MRTTTALPAPAPSPIMTTQCPKTPQAIYPRARYGDRCYIHVVSTQNAGGATPSGGSASAYSVSTAYDPAYPNVAHGNFFLTFAPSAEATEHILQPPFKPGTTEAANLIGKDIAPGANVLLQTTQNVPIDNDNTRIYLGGGYWNNYYYRSYNGGANNEYWQFVPSISGQATDGVYWGQSYYLKNASYNQYGFVDWSAPNIQLGSKSDQASTADQFNVIPSQWIIYYCDAPGQAGGGACSVYCGIQLLTQKTVLCDSKRGCVTGSSRGFDVPVYGTLAECQQTCAVQRWACINGTCQQTNDPTIAGDYTTLEQCQQRTNQCKAPYYSCSSQQTCQQDVNGTATLAQCQNACKRTYNCNPKTCQCFWDPTGNETNKADCDRACKDSAACKKSDDGGGGNNDGKGSTPPGPSRAVQAAALAIIAVIIGVIVYVVFFQRPRPSNNTYRTGGAKNTGTNNASLPPLADVFGVSAPSVSQQN